MALKRIILLAAGVLLLVPFLALAQVAEPNVLDVPRQVHETRAELRALGCDEVDLADEQTLLAARSLGWRVVLPPDAANQVVVLCPQAAIDGLQPLREGQVEAAVAEAQGLGGGPSFDDSAAAQNLVGEENELNPAARFLVWLLKGLAEVGKRMLTALLRAIMPLLAIGGFYSNEFVKTGWTAALGVANLGFMLALVLIALLVTLRLDDGGGIRRLLPRFLLGALLVNFSLIIGVLIIDFSRLIMAVLMSFFGYGDHLALLTAFQREINIADTVRILGDFFSAITDETTDYFGTGYVVGAILLVLVVFMLAGGALVVFVGLLIRFLVLAVLLVLSPFAYLFVAFPNTANLAKLWWKQFFRYVFYAPAVLMILILTVKMAESSLWDDLVVFVPVPGDPNRADVDVTLRMLAHKVAIAVGLMVAAGSGRWAGVVGSTAAMSAVSRAGAKGKGVYLRGLRRGAGGVATVTGARAAKQQVGAQLGMFGRTAGKNMVSYIPGISKGAKTKGGPLADRWLPSKSDREARGAAVTAAKAGLFGDKALAAPKLANSVVGAHLARQAAPQVVRMGRMGSTSQVGAMVKNKELVRNLDDEQRVNLTVSIERNSRIDPKDKQKMINELNNSIRDIESKDYKA